MRTQRLPPELLSQTDSDIPSCSTSSDEDDGIDDTVAVDSDALGTGNDLDEYDLDASDTSDSDEQPAMPFRRTKSTSAAGGIPFISKKLNLRRAIWRGSPHEDISTADSTAPMKLQLDATRSDTALSTTRDTDVPGNVSAKNHQDPSPSQAGPVRSPPIRNHSLLKFTSNPTPRTAVVPEELPGSSIMFVETPAPSASRKKDTIASAAEGSSKFVEPANHPSPGCIEKEAMASSSRPQASGYPLQQSIPLSFNDLPCRAQHLILNELIRQHSDETAVVFTTLPSPVDGTSESESESVKYISDLEVLCQGLPPCLLVHSNSMTVTMNL